MIEALKIKASKLGADSIVIIDEGNSVTQIPNPFGGDGTIDFFDIYIRGVAIVY